MGEIRKYNGLDYDLGVMVGNCYYEPHSYCYTGLVCQDTPPPPPIEEVGGMKRVTASVRHSVKSCMFGIASFAMSKLKARLCLTY